MCAGEFETRALNYEFSDELQQQTIELSEALDLDEIESAGLLEDALYTSVTLDRPPIITAIINYHQAREYCFQCLRLVLERTREAALGEEVITGFENFLALLLQDAHGKTLSEQGFWTECIESMSEIERWMDKLNERIHRVTVTEQFQSPEFQEVMDFQCRSLSQQHEQLGVVAYHLAGRGKLTAESLRWYITRLKKIEKYDAIAVHQLPTLFATINNLAPSESMCTGEDAKGLHNLITSSKESDLWSLPQLQAATSVIWVADYSARFTDRAGPSTSRSRSSAELDDCETCFTQSLKNGASQFLLALSHDIRSTEWYDPAKQGFHTFLIQDTPTLHSDRFSIDEGLRDAIMESLQDFAESLITNLPDSLRKLKLEEDEQRRQLQGRPQLRPAEFELHLERFLLMISNAYAGYVEASDRFWSGAESNLYGFLQWASQRQSTPRIAAFSELLQSLSPDESGADHAHEFLVDDSSTAGSLRPRRSSPLSWSHIFRELEYYSATIRDKPAIQSSNITSSLRPQPDLGVEPESAMMLECYLRLISHLAVCSQKARFYLLNAQSDVLSNLLLLCASSIPSRLRGCAFTALAGLLTHKDRVLRDHLWTAIDAWIYGQPSGLSQAPRSLQTQDSVTGTGRVAFDKILSGFEEPNAFVRLLTSLIIPLEKDIPLKDSVQFPEELGGKYRMAGIEPYVDFVLGSVFTTKSRELSDPLQLRILRCNCLTFAASCLLDFNEELIVLAHRSNIIVEKAMEISSLSVYARTHPFARVMEWLFNDRVVTALFQAAIQDIREVNNAESDSPLLISLLKSLEVIHLALSLQRTYLDIVRPAVQTQSNGRRNAIANAAYASFEDVILGHLDLVTSLGLYCSSGHADLAVSAFRVLRRMAESRKMSAPVSNGSGSNLEKGRLIVAFEKDHQADSTCRAMASIMEFDMREWQAGADAPGMAIKSGLLHFLISSLDTVKDSPTIAHLLLGFDCHAHSLARGPSSLFGNPASLFDTLMAFSSVLPDELPPDSHHYSSWSLDLRNQSLQILRRLWRSPLSSTMVLDELHSHDYFPMQALRLTRISINDRWDDCSIQDLSFWTSESAQGYINFLAIRTVLFELAAIQIRAAKASSQRSRLLRSLLGSTELLDGTSYRNADIFDVLDFIDFPTGPNIAFPPSRYFEAAMFDVCANDNEEPNMLTTYDMEAIEQVLLVRQNELQKRQPAALLDSEPGSPQEEAIRIKLFFLANNAKASVFATRIITLRQWTGLVTVMLLDGFAHDKDAQEQLTVRVLQSILPKMERAIHEDMSIAEIFAEFVVVLVRISHFKIIVENDRPDNYDTLFDLLRICLMAAQSPDATSTLRQMCTTSSRIFICSICRGSKHLVRRVLNTCRTLGGRLVEAICEDASRGEGQSRVSSMLLLESLAQVANFADPKYIVDALNRYNFLQMIVRYVGGVSVEYQQCEAEGTTSNTSFHQS